MLFNKIICCFVKTFNLGNPPRHEYPEYSSLLLNCSASVSNNRQIQWRICLSGSEVVLCARNPATTSCEGSIDPRFYGRVEYVDAAANIIINVTKEESGTLSCYRAYDDQRVYLYTANIIGHHLFQF